MHNEVAGIVAALMREIEERGIPEGAWLIEIDRARRHLRELDDVLRRLQDVIARKYADRPEDPP